MFGQIRGDFAGRHGDILRADTGVCPYTWVRPFFGMGKGMWVATLKIIQK